VAAAPRTAGPAAAHHGRAIGLMVLAAVLWSTAGVVSRFLSPALLAEGKFELVFWRSLFAALGVAGYLAWTRYDIKDWLRRASWPGLVSCLCWGGMFTAFMVALAYTSVARVLVVSALGPLMTAVLARVLLRSPLPTRTWIAIIAASIGLTWMVAHAGQGGARPAGHDLLGMGIAALVPLCSAINLVTLQRFGRSLDLVPAVMGGALLSTAFAYFLAGGFTATALDVGLLGGLGLLQLALPCALMVLAARHLTAPEVALLALLEIVLGPIWAWLGAGEVPARATLMGGALVLAALVGNELAGRRAALVRR
jgi:drug/metabolite transporter (DMT)-like permease